MWVSLQWRRESKMDTVKNPPFMAGGGLDTLLLDTGLFRPALGSYGWFGWGSLRPRLLSGSRRSGRSSNYWLCRLGGRDFCFRRTTNNLFVSKHLEAVLSQVLQNAIAVSGCSPWDQDAIYPLVGNVARVDAFRVARIRDFDEFYNLFIREGGSDMATGGCFNST